MSPLSILIFDRQGTFQKRFSKKGQGPDEYMSIASWDVNPNGQLIAIADMVKKAIFLYSLDGLLVDKTVLKDPPLDVYFINNKTVVFNLLCPVGLNNYPILQRYDINNQLVSILRETDFINQNRKFFSPMGMNSFLHRYNGDLFFSVPNNDTLFGIDQKGDISGRLTIPIISKNDDTEINGLIPYSFFQTGEFMFFLSNPMFWVRLMI